MTAQSPPAATARFDARTATQQLWANAEGHPSIWMRWMPWHEGMVESEQPMTYRRLGTVGRIVKCGKFGTWFVGDWRPACATCQGTGLAEIGPATQESGHPERKDWVAAVVRTLDAGLYYLLVNLVECPDCLAHPGWVVG